MQCLVCLYIFTRKLYPKLADNVETRKQTGKDYVYDCLLSAGNKNEKKPFVQAFLTHIDYTMLIGQTEQDPLNMAHYDHLSGFVLFAHFNGSHFCAVSACI